MPSQSVSDDQHRAEMWALANDDNFRNLLVWRRVKARAEAGGFNGVLIHDFRAADEALAALTTMTPRDRVDDWPSGVEVGYDKP